MKAIILAGGEGKRLRPLTSTMPKPMVPLFDKPILTYVLRILKNCGITDAALTVAYLPEAIENAFGDGSEYGMHLTYFRDPAPLGTAGSVAACAEYLQGEENFLVISGDCFCDFDLQEAIACHRVHSHEATLVLSRQAEPLEYGLVLLEQEPDTRNPQGGIAGFVEKPGWGQVCTDIVNTGIYVLRRSVLDRIPKDRSFDFGKDLFPAMVRERQLVGIVLDGYWCDVGGFAALHRCTQAAMDGKVRGDRLGLQDFCHIEPPEGVQIRPPVYLGKNVTARQGCTLGPYACIGENSSIDTGSTVSHTLCESVSVGAESTVDGAILAGGVQIGQHCRILPGAVLGRNVRVQDRVSIAENVQIWPEKTVEAGQTVSRNLTERTETVPFRLNDAGCFTLTADASAPDAVVTLGAALGRLYCKENVSLGCDGSDAAETLRKALESGVRGAGCTVVLHDAAFAASARYLTRLSGCGCGVFVSHAGDECRISVWDGTGFPLHRDTVRKLENLYGETEDQAPAAPVYGRALEILGAQRLYAAWISPDNVPEKGTAFSIRSFGGSENADFPAARQLESLLEALGGIADPDALRVWELSEDGLSLACVDEHGVYHDDCHTQAVAILCRLQEGMAGELPVPQRLPAVLESMMRKRHCQPVFAETPAQKLRCAEDPWLWDGIGRAVYLTRWCAENGKTLAQAAAQLPHFCMRSREMALQHDRAGIMEALRETLDATAAELADGLTVQTAACRIHVHPCSDAEALRIQVESCDEETAEEMCDLIAGTARDLDLRKGNTEG